MKPRAVAMLALVVAGLAAFVFFYERDLPSSEERKELAKKVFRVEPGEITRLEIETPDRRIVLAKDTTAAPAGEENAPPPLAAPAEWRLVEPLAARADRSLVERLSSDLAGLEFSRQLDGISRADVGLEPARGTVRWSSGSGAGSVEIGGAVPASSNVVVSASGHDRPLVVGDVLVASLERAPGDWRAKELVEAGRDEVERIRIVPTKGEEVALSRHGESFVVERPFADAADRDLVDPLLGDLTGLRAERFLDAPLAPADEAALVAGPGRIEVSLRGRTEPLVIDVGAADGEGGGRALRVDGQAVVAAARFQEALERPAAEWRSKAWSGFESWRVERIRVEDGAGVLELIREGGDWSRGGATVPYAEAADLLHAITSTRADRVVPADRAGGYPLAHPALTIVLADAEGAEQTLTAYAADASGAIPARVSGRGVVLLLPASAREELDQRVAAVRAAEPVEADPADAETSAGE